MRKLNRVLVAFYVRTANRIHEQKGQSLTEYTMVLALVAVAAAATVSGLSSKIGTTLTSIGNAL